jgi:hypothetical protein
MGDAADTSTNPCAGWESDLESMAIKIAKKCAFECFNWPSTTMVRTVNAGNQPVFVNFDNGESISVTWDPNAKTASAAWIPDPTNFYGATYSYTCTPTDGLILTVASCTGGR